MYSPVDRPAPVVTADHFRCLATRCRPLEFGAAVSLMAIKLSDLGRLTEAGRLGVRSRRRWAAGGLDEPRTEKSIGGQGYGTCHTNMDLQLKCIFTLVPTNTAVLHYITII
jgi:hypothetical protein